MNNKIVTIANAYIGQQEKAGNAGFKSADFEKKMRTVGFQPGHAWCAYFVELVWKEAYASDVKMLGVLDKLCSASAVSTFANFANSKLFTTSTTVPVKGAIVIWRHGNSWQGHAGIVSDVDLQQNRFIATEGNSNDKGGREGYIVSNRPRKLGLPHSDTGLNIVGFIYPK